jgi:hypothetical protein
MGASGGAGRGSRTLTDKAAAPPCAAPPTGIDCARTTPAVGGAHGFCGNDLDRQRELPHHVAQHDVLLVILLAEDGRMRPDHVEELQHHGRDPRKCRAGPRLRGCAADRKARPRRSAARGRSRVRRGEHDVDAGCTALVEIALQRARIALEVLAGPNCRRFTNMLTTVHAARGLAILISCMWPWCRLPMVGTNTLFGTRSRRSRKAATEWMTSMGDFESNCDENSRRKAVGAAPRSCARDQETPSPSLASRRPRRRSGYCLHRP